MSRRFFQLVFFPLLGCSFVLTAEAAEPRKVTAVEGITEFQLDNGLKLLLFPDASRPTVTVNMTVLVGSRHDAGNGTGMASAALAHRGFRVPLPRETPSAG